MSSYKFYRKETQTTEEVQKERWSWVAIYRNGLILSQFDNDTLTFHQFREIDQSQLQFFKMVNRLTGQEFKLEFDPNTMDLIHFYRNVRVNVGTGKEKRLRLYCFGYRKRHDMSQICLMAIDGQDNLHICNDKYISVI